MIFSYDTFCRLEKPILYLANPNKAYFGTISPIDLHTDLCFNSMSELTFTCYKYSNGIQAPLYDEIEVLKLVEAAYIGWFQIVSCTEHGEGATLYKEVTALSLENELTTKVLTSFGQMDTGSSQQGGLDRYCLYNIMDTSHSLLHLIMEKAPQWTVGHIDSGITTQYRSFNQDSIDAYSLLTNDAAKAFSCIFLFDTFDRTIHAYQLENIGKQTTIYLSHRNVIEHAQIEERADEIRTVLSVAGGDNRGTPLQITDVNPTGTSYLTNYSYYYPWFSEPLKTKLTAFLEACEQRKGGYANAVSHLKVLLSQLEELKNRVPKTPHSTNWEEYGTVELQSEFDYYNQKMSLYLQGQNEKKRMEYYTILYGINGISNALTKRKEEYAAKEQQILQQKNICSHFVLNMEDFLGNALYKELSAYNHYADFIDDTFVATNAMEDSEILEMKLALLEQAEQRLCEIAKPAYTMTLDSQNFAALEKYQSYARQLELGCLVTVEFEEDRLIYPRLLKMSIDWDDYTSFQLVFSSKTRLDDGLLQLEEVQKQTSSAVTSHLLSGIGWDAAKNQMSAVTEFMKNAFDASLNALQSGKNIEMLVDGAGIRLRKWLDEKNDYSKNQMWLTNNGLYLSNSAWESVDTAIGELNLGKDDNGNDIILYGIAAPLLLGKMTISQYLYIYNDSGTYTITDDGFVATNDINTLKITPNDKDCIFSILKNGEKQIWLDTDGNAWFTGNITASEITASKFTCTNGVNTILIDPDEKELFQILKEDEKVLYFTEDGDGVFEGKITVGTIFSKNWLSSGGSEDGLKAGTEGTFIDLTKGTFHFGGKHLELTENFLKCTGIGAYEWWGQVYPEAKRSTKISDGGILLKYDTGTSGDLYITPKGISTGAKGNPDPSAPDANAGIIDFDSQHLGQSHHGITVRTRNSPVCISSAGSAVVLNPNDGSCNKAMFRFGITSNGHGHVKFGDCKAESYTSGIRFISGSPEIYITDGNEGLGSLKCEAIDIKAKATLGGDALVTRAEMESYVKAKRSEWYQEGFRAGVNSVPPCTRPHV